MKVLLTGASGLLGRSIYERFSKESDWVVCGISYKRQVFIYCYLNKIVSSSTLKHTSTGNILLIIKKKFDLVPRTAPGLTKLNLLDKDAVTNLLNSECPDAIIHCAAERFPDKVERDPEAAYNLNVEVSAHLADLASKLFTLCQFKIKLHLYTYKSTEMNL